MRWSADFWIPGNPQDDYLFAELRERLALAISRLSEREQRVLGMYYNDDMSLKEIGDVFDVTESRICQIHTKSVMSLRNRLLEPGQRPG